MPRGLPFLAVWPAGKKCPHEEKTWNLGTGERWLSVTDTAILGGVADRIGFQSVDASATLTFPIEKSTVETNFDPTVTLVDATAVDLEFYYDGAGLEIFVDGVSEGRPAVTNIPDDVVMRISWEFLNGATGAETMDINRITCIQIGR